MARKFFGTDGVRGCVGESPMTPDVLARLGFAAGKVLGKMNKAPQVLISKDTRLSGYMVESALEAGFSAAGVDVLLSGPLPTSAVSYLTQTLRLTAGVIISASHNPYGDNGVKFFGADGYKLSNEVEQEIEEAMYESDSLSFSGYLPGRARRLDAAGDRYIEFCKRAIPSSMSLGGMRLLVDCANGAAYHVAPPILHELGADVIAIADHPDGININVECGVMHPQFAAKAAQEHGVDAAIILDGDADRVYMADSDGCVYNGDALLYLIAKDLCASGQPPAGIVGTQMSNLALEQALKSMGVDFERADIGDRYVLQKLLKRQWRIGGEPSGHIILRDLHCTGDGILAALRVLAIMRKQDKPLNELMEGYSPMPQYQENISVSNREVVFNHPDVAQCIDAVKQNLAGRGRVLARLSGTENLIRVMVEADSMETAKQSAENIKATLAKCAQ